MNEADLLYAETHEWARVEDQGEEKIATIGITGFAVEQLTDLVYIEMPKVGTIVNAGGEFGEVESVKAVSPLYSPVNGTISEVNTRLSDRLEVLNEDPFGAGWIMRVRISDDSSLGKLMDHAAYQKQCADEQ